MATSKLTKKELPFLKDKLEISPEIQRRVLALQKEHQAKFDRLVSTSKEKALDRYEKRLESLTKAKSEAAKKYNAEIKKVSELIANLKKDTDPGDSRRRGDIRGSDLKRGRQTKPTTRKKGTGRTSTRTGRARKKGDKK